MKTKTLVIAILIGALLGLPFMPAWAAGSINLSPTIISPTITPIITPVVPDLFVSRHEVIKSIPLHRVVMVYMALGCHSYTSNEDMFKTALKMPSFFADDGLVAYVSPVPLPYSVPVWKLHKLNGLDEYLVTSQTQRELLKLMYGYIDQGIVGYAVDLADAAHGNIQVYQHYNGIMNQGPATDANQYKDHYYCSDWALPANYTYEGPKFKAWSGASTLQEVTVLSPNGGETLTGGTNVNITWKTLVPGGNISLFYTLDPAVGWTAIAKDLPNTGTYAWTVPNSATSKAIVEARWTYDGIDGNCFDQSDKYFTIKTGAGSIVNWLIFKPVTLGQMLGPATPTNLNVSSSPGQEQPVLVWQDNATNETGYVIERKATGGSFAKLTQIAANETDYTDNTAAKGITFYYRVKAVNSNSSSGYSNEAAGSVYSEPGANPPPPPPGQVSMLFTLNQNTYLVNGVSKTMDVSPVALEGRTMLPIRFAADPLGAITVWNGDENKVTVTLGNTKIELWIGSNLALINGSGTLIDPNNPEVKPIIMNDRTMLPMRFVTEKLGCSVEWLPATNQINVQYPAS